MLPLIVDDTLLDAVRLVESAGDNRAVSSAGAKGPYQLMDATGMEWHKLLKIKEKYNPFDPKQSRQIAKSYLRRLSQIFPNMSLAVAAYNCGPGRLNKATKQVGSTIWESVKGTCPEETQAYVTKVSDKYDELKRRGSEGNDGALSEWFNRLLTAFKSERDFVQPRPDVSAQVDNGTFKQGEKVMLEYLKKLVAGNIAKSVIRKLMVLVSGYLLGIGVDSTVVDQFTSSSTTVIIAVVLYIIAQGWSLVEKKAKASVTA